MNETLQKKKLKANRGTVYSGENSIWYHFGLKYFSFYCSYAATKVKHFLRAILSSAIHLMSPLRITI